MKRPKNMTNDELEALPTGPMRYDELPITEEDRKRGMQGSVKRIPRMEPTRVMKMYPDDLVGFRDRDGFAWTFGQFADGTWFKQ